MSSNAVNNDSKIDLNDKEYVDLEDSSMRVYSLLQGRYVSKLFVVDKISDTNFYSVSTDSGLLVKINLKKVRYILKILLHMIIKIIFLEKIRKISPSTAVINSFSIIRN